MIDHDHLARFDVANILRIDQIKRTRFRGDDPRVAQPSQREWTKATRSRIAIISDGVRNSISLAPSVSRQNFRYRFANR